VDAALVAIGINGSGAEQYQVGAHMAKMQVDIENEDTLAADSVPREALGDSSHLSAIEVLVQLADRKALIAKMTCAAILIGVILSVLLPVRYTAVTKIMPPQQTQSTASLLMNQLGMFGGGAMSAMAGGGLSLKNPNDIYIGLLNSRTIADEVIQRHNLMAEYHAKDMTAARKKLAEFTEVVSERSGLISVSVADRDKKRAAAIANDYTDELRNLTKSLAVTEASQRRMFYEGQIKQSKEALLAAALAFQQVQQKKGLVQLDAQAKVMIEALSVLRAQVGAKEVELQALRSYSTDNNPQVQLAERELASLRDQELQMEKRGGAPGISGLGLENVPSAGLDYLRAQHELQYQQVLYDMLMKQYDAARIDESKDAAIIQIVEPAIDPDKKSSPRRGLIITLFTISGFLIGCIVAMLSWWREMAQLDPYITSKLQRLSAALSVNRSPGRQQRSSAKA
jgi:tyrosine-protein kinase Etk/Wzc